MLRFITLMRTSALVVALLILCGRAFAQPAGFVRLDSPSFPTSKLLAADVDGDTRQDLIAGTETGFIGDRDHTISVYHGNGDGRFTLSGRYFIGIPTEAGFIEPYITDLFVGDVNGDDRPDIVALMSDTDGGCDVVSGVCSGDDSHLAVLLGQVGGTFSAPIRRFLPFARVAGTGDVNGDGRVDVVVNDNVNGPNHFRVLLGRSDGTFQMSTTVPPTSDTRVMLNSIAIAEISGDGRNDLVFYELLDDGPSQQLRIVRGNGDGTFQLASTTVLPAPPGLNGRLAIADLDRNGNQDIVAADRGVTAFYNFGGTLFPVPLLTGSRTRDVLIGDLTRDGWPDILAYVISPGNDWAIVPGNGRGGLGSPESFPLGSETIATLGDFNRDGRLDAATVHRTLGGASAFLNTPPDLAISKSQVGEFVAGGTGTYALNVRNAGLGATVEPGGLIVRDLLPPSLTYVLATGPGWSCGAIGPEVECRRVSPPLAAGEETKITLEVAIAGNAPSEIMNTATVSTLGDFNPVNDTGGKSVRIRHPNLALTKTAEESVFYVGATQTYVLTVTNVGDADAGLFGQQIVVTDPLPRGLTLVSADAGCGGVGFVLTCCLVEPLAPGASAAFRLRVRVGFEIGGGIVVNRATVSHPADIDPSNDAASVSRFVQVDATLAINLLQQNVALLPVNRGLKMALSAPLQSALAALGRQEPETAVDQLQAFQHQADAFSKTGKIEEADAAALIDGAGITIGAISKQPGKF
jgi:uncharacterized repeat protein (TIGR01451 family)